MSPFPKLLFTIKSYRCKGCNGWHPIRRSDNTCKHCGHPYTLKPSVTIHCVTCKNAGVVKVATYRVGGIGFCMDHKEKGVMMRLKAAARFDSQAKTEHITKLKKLSDNFALRNLSKQQQTVTGLRGKR